MRKIISILLALVSFIFCLVGCDNGTSTNIIKKDKVDYSNYNDQFDYYAYSSATLGVVKIDSQVIRNVGSSLNKEQYQLFKDCGFTIFYPQSALQISTGSPSEDIKKLKEELVKLKEVGITKTIVTDERVSVLSVSSYDGLVGEGKRFKTEEDLDNKINTWISQYATTEGVYGIMLSDEPMYKHIKAYSEVYKSLKRLNKKYGYNLVVYYNLIPCTLYQPVVESHLPVVAGAETYNYENAFTRYKKYIVDFLDAMEPDFIQYDDYPLRNNSILKPYFATLDFVASECSKRGIDFYFVAQSFDMYTGGVQAMRGQLSKQEAKWLNNSMIGFGVKQISYYTYYTRGVGSSSGETNIDNGASFMSLDQKPTAFYYTMKEIMADNQKFAPIVKQFDFCGSRIIKKIPLNYAADYASTIDNTYVFKCVDECSVDKECALVTELYDDENENYMIMAMNIVDPAKTADNTIEKITLKFKDNYKNVLLYRDGVTTKEKLTDGKIVIEVNPGDASFVIPY